MPNFHRYYFENSTVFITNVTEGRKPLLEDPKIIEVFWTTLKNVQQIYPFELLAYVILPDHFHWLIHYTNIANNYSVILHSFKRNFTRNIKKEFGINIPLKFWQTRYWDHVIRDEKDFQRHLDYIHWNPVKHGLAGDALDWQQSSFSTWVAQEYYDDQWGRNEEPKNIQKMNFE